MRSLRGHRNETLPENLSRRLSGLTKSNLREVEALRPGSPLFLFNVNDKRLHGIFEAVRLGPGCGTPPCACPCDRPHLHCPLPATRPPLQTGPGGLNLVQEAWLTSSAAKIPNGGSPFPAQARSPPLP